MRARVAASMTGEGASSKTFWWRRWSEQSRSPRVHRVALAVAEDLDLDVARGGEVFLEIDLVVAEGCLGLGAGGVERGLEILGGFRELHAAPAAAGRGLDDEREADLRADADRVLKGGHAAFGAGNAGHAKCEHRLLGGDLVAHQADVLGGRADEGDAVILDDLHERGVLGEEAVARMDRLGAGDLAGGDDVGDGEVALRGRGRADADALVGHADVHRVGVGGRMDRDGLDAHLLAGAVDAERDLAAVGDQDLLEHGRLSLRAARGHSRTISGAPNSTGAPSSTRMRFTVPARGAGIWFMVFIASMIRKVWPSLSVSPTLMNGSAPGSA